MNSIPSEDSSEIGNGISESGVHGSDDVHIDVEAEAALAKTLHEAEQLHKH